MLEIFNLGKRFGAIEALKDVSLNVGNDELCVILGPTGAGKTTLRLLAGLETPDGGSIRLGGEDIGGRSPADRDVALVFQNFSLYPGWSVRRNLEFPLRAPGRDLSEMEIEARVSQAADVLHIRGFLDRAAEQLSGGEMQRVAIGRAIVRRPRLFLMDEPLGNLDAKLREQLRVELVLLRRELALPMIYVTHDQAEAMSMADRMAVLSHGQLLQFGTPVELYERPVSPAVARQLGQTRINILRARFHSDKMVLSVAARPSPADTDRREIVLDAAHQRPAGRDTYLLGIRPEDVEPTGGAHPGRVVIVEDAGPHFVVLIDWAGLPIHSIHGKGGIPPRPGDTLFPRLRMDRAVWWDHQE